MILTIDTGGTKTLIACFSDDGSITKEHRFPTPHDSEDYLRVLCNTLRDHFVGDEAPRAVVVASPGLNDDGVITWGGHRLRWRNVPVVQTVEQLFPGIPVALENDANLGGLGEIRHLKTIPKIGLYLTVSTDIGTGIITNGTIDQTLRHSEGGHAIIEYGGTLQRWGDFSSGRAIYETFGSYARDIHDQAVWDDIADRISRGLLAELPLLQPEVVVIGGSIGTYFSQYGATLSNILSRHLGDYIPVPTLLEAHDAERAVIYGCYYYGIDLAAR